MQVTCILSLLQQVISEICMFCIYIIIAMNRINFISAFCSYYMCVFCLSSLMLLNMEA